LTAEQKEKLDELRVKSSFLGAAGEAVALDLIPGPGELDGDIGN
jgi:hypothetical protein